MLRKRLRELRAWAKLLATGRRYRPTILMYHSVGLNRAHFTVAPEAFRAQIAFLKEKGFEIISLEACLRRSKAGETGKLVALTFDDGYRDFLSNAWPVLRGYGFPASVFLIAGRMDADYEASGGEKIPLLSWEEAASLQREGVVFGSHTVTHPKLTKIPLEEARKELEMSRDVLRQRLGVGPSFICYPHGRASTEIHAMAREAGYVGGLSITPGHPGPDTDPFDVPRAYVHSEMGPKEFEACLT